VILLPPAFESLNPGARQAIACHELLHVARHDWLAILVEEAIACAFWFHPAMRWALDQLALGREQLIDEAVVARTNARREYVEALLLFAGGTPARAPALPFGSRQHLIGRVRNLCAQGVTRPTPVRGHMALVALLVLMASGAAARAMPLQRTPADARPLRVGGAVKPPRVLREVRPVYSQDALRSKLTGEVTLDVVVAADGSVRDVRVVKSIPAFDQSAIDAARQWRFEPGRVKGRAVDVAVTLLFRFTVK
jgi:TonB family protein